MSAAAFFNHLAFGALLTLVSALLTWVIMRRVRILDTPNERSSHTRPTPRSGGIAIVVTYFIGLLLLYFFGNESRIAEPHFIGFIVAALAIGAFSIIDDLRSMGFAAKLGFQVVAALVVMAFGIVINRLQLPFVGTVELGLMAWPVTLLWIIGLTNAYNFMDGLDGLAGGTAVVVALLFALVTFIEGSSFVYLTSIIVACSALGFLFWNFPPARVFMGDSGSQFLGFVFAVMAIIAALFDQSHTSFLVMPLLFFHFIWDTAFTFFRRLRAREPVTSAHRSHLYQLMNRLGASHLQVTTFQLAMVAAQGVGALVIISVPGELRAWVFVPFIIFQVLYTRNVTRRARQAGLLA